MARLEKKEAVDPVGFLAELGIFDKAFAKFLRERCSSFVPLRNCEHFVVIAHDVFWMLDVRFGCFSMLLVDCSVISLCTNVIDLVVACLDMFVLLRKSELFCYFFCVFYLFSLLLMITHDVFWMLDI